MPNSFLDETPADTGPEKESSVDTVTEPLTYVTPSAGENIRRSGLAWSAGIVFFSSVVFMLFLGWIADLVFGSWPWGLVGGIVLGSVIGFVQFFRISSQIYNTDKAEHKMSPLLSQTEDDD